MTAVSRRVPVDVREALKRVAPLRGFSGAQPLARASIGQGLRMALERLQHDAVVALVESLQRHGVSEEVVNAALDEVAHRYKVIGGALSPLLGGGHRALETALDEIVSLRWDLLGPVQSSGR